MNGLENFHATFHGDAAERLPFDLPVTPPVADLLEERCGSRDPCVALGAEFRCLWPSIEPAGNWHEALADLGIPVPERVEFNALGIGELKPEHPSNGASHFTQIIHALETVESVQDLETLPWPDMSDPKHYAKMAEEVRRTLDEGIVPFGGCECTLFEPSWYVRGMDQLFCDLEEENPVGKWLLDWFTERSKIVARHMVAAGFLLIRLGDDIGTQQSMLLSVPTWRRHLQPRLREVIRAIREAPGGENVLIAYHSDGAIHDVIPDLIDTGIDILNPVQPECLDVAHTLHTYKDRLGFWGMIGTQTTLPFGSPEEIRATVHMLADAARNGVRLIAAPTHVIEPDVPFENLKVLADAIQSSAAYI
jgi:uroporphyrinogen decarboxylase